MSDEQKVNVEAVKPEVKPEIKPEIKQEGQVTPILLDSLIENDDTIKKWFMSRTDKRVSQAITTHDEKTKEAVRQEIENEVRAQFLPKETPEQQRLLAVENELAENKRKAKVQELKNYALITANHLDLQGLGDNISYFLADSEEAILARLDWLKDRDKLMFEKGRASFLKENAYVPQEGDGNEEKLPFADLLQYGRYLKKHPDKYDRKLYEKIAAREQRR